MNPHLRHRLLVVAGITEAICGGIEFFVEHKTYGVAFIFLGLMFVLTGLAKDKPAG